jgi:hypothetical protein
MQNKVINVHEDVITFLKPNLFFNVDLPPQSVARSMKNEIMSLFLSCNKGLITPVRKMVINLGGNKVFSLKYI